MFKIQFRTQSMKRWSDLKPRASFETAAAARCYAVSEAKQRTTLRGCWLRGIKELDGKRAVWMFGPNDVELEQWKREQDSSTNRTRELESALRVAKYNEERLSERLDHIRREITDKLNQEWQGKVNKAWFDGADSTRRTLESANRRLAAQLPTKLEQTILKEVLELRILFWVDELSIVPGSALMPLARAVRVYREAELAPNRQALLSTLMARMHQQLDIVYRPK